MENLDQVLKERRHRSRPWYRGGSLAGALLVHVFLAFAVFVAPLLFAERAPLPEFVAVQIVPAAALGQLAPPPAPPAPQPEVAPIPEPEPEKETPAEPEPKPVERKPPPRPRETRSPTARRTPEREAPPPPEALPLQQPADDIQRRQGSPRGDPLGTSTSPTEISGFDDPDFTYSYYADLLLARIRAGWRRPPIGGEIEMVVHFKVYRDGRISDLRILRSSGYNSFDRSGLRAVQAAALPPLPKSYRRDTLGVRLIVR